MAKKSPLQQVRDRFGSKEELAKLLIPKLERPFEDEDDDFFELRIRTMSNKKLLRLHDALEEVQERFGGKSGLVDAIIELKYGGSADSGVREKLEGYRVTRLLDLHRNAERKASTN